MGAVALRSTGKCAQTASSAVVHLSVVVVIVLLSCGVALVGV